MRKLLKVFLTLSAGLAIASCAKEYDDTELKGKVDALDKKVSALDQKVNALSEQVTGLAATIDEWKKGGFVESIQEIEGGYTITFLGGKTVTLYDGKNGKDGTNGKDGEDGKDGTDGTNGTNGTDGADGKTPQIISYNDELVWAIDGEPILVGGKPVPANVVPTFQIKEDGHLWMTLAGAETDLGKVVGEGGGGAGGDGLIDEITPGEEVVVFKLTNGTEFSIPLAKAFKLVIANKEYEAAAGATLKIDFTVTNGTAEMVDCFAGGLYNAKIVGSQVVVDVPDPFQAGQVLVWAQNDKGLFSMVKLSFITAAELVVVTPEDEIKAIPSAAGDFVIALTSNVDVEVSEPAVDWVKAVITKADYTLTLTLLENETGEPRETDIEVVRKDNGNLVQKIHIIQLGGAPVKKDILNNAFTGISGTSYADWADKAGASGAVYAGNSAGDKTSIQLRSDIKNNMYAGVVTTTSGGLVKHVKITWNTGTSVSRYVDVYGSNTAYTSSADLYDHAKRGNLIGTLAYTSAEANVAEFDVVGDYAYVGFRSRKSAQYLDEVVITWEDGTPAPAAEPSLDWDFSAQEWQDIFATYGTAGSDITGWNILHDGLQIVSIIDKSKYQTNCFQMGGKANEVSPVVVDRYFTFTAPKDGYVLVKASNTGDSEAATRLVNVANNNAVANQIGGSPSSNPLYLVFPVKAGNVTIYPSGDGLRFYKIAFSETEPAMQLERQTGWYSGANLWTTNVTAISITHPDVYGMARGLAMDNEYVYLPKASAYPALVGLNISDPATQVKGDVTGVDAGDTFKSSFVRMIKNTDPEVNGGKDVLLMSNLSAANGGNIVIYAYPNGITAAPIKLAQFAWDSANNTEDWRRYGDRFYVTGTWQEGKVYLPSFNNPKIVVLSVANGERTAVQQIHAGEANPNGIKDLTVYPGDNKLFLTNGDIANLVAADGTTTNGWDTYALSASSEKGKGTWGYNFFKFNGKNWIAYARIDGEKAWVEIIEDKGDLITSLEAQEGLMKAPLHSADNLDAAHATGGVADCCVRVINGEVVIAAMTRDGGFVIDKLLFK